MWWTMRYVAIIWVAQLNFWISKTGLTGWAEVADVPANSLTLIPTFAVSAPTMLPSLETWWPTALGCAIAWLATILVPRHRLPMIYTLRLLMLVRLSALVFFYQWPESIPTTTANFLTDIFRQSAGLVLLIPSLFALTLYLFPAAVVGKDRCDFFCNFCLCSCSCRCRPRTKPGFCKRETSCLCQPFFCFSGSGHKSSD